MSSPPATFPQFARLATEIRLLIWREYLLAFDKPTVYLFTKNFFLKQLDPEGEDERYAGISRTPSVQVDMPASLHVDAESRGATLQWARARDMELRRRRETGGGGCYVLARPFNAARDALYVSRDKWDEFCELSFEGDGLEETAARIRHLALPAFTAYYSFTELGYLMSWFPGLKSLSCVWGALPELEYAAPTRRRFLRGRRRRRRRRLLGIDDDDDDDDDDGTDTGVDPATGELEEERIAVEVQPRWVLEEETADVVTMCVRDPSDGTYSWEAGEREMWMGELEDALLTVELPEHVYDVEEERFLVEFRAVRAVQE